MNSNNNVNFGLQGSVEQTIKQTHTVNNAELERALEQFVRLARVLAAEPGLESQRGALEEKIQVLETTGGAGDRKLLRKAVDAIGEVATGAAGNLVASGVGTAYTALLACL